MPEDSTPMLAAEIIVSQNSPAQCTIFPPDATCFERLTTWITAKEGSFISLEDMR
ncbi:transcriptional regulator [Haloplanus sp. GCM10025708]